MSFEHDSVAWLWAHTEWNRNFARRTVTMQLALTLIPHFENVKTWLLPDSGKDFIVPEQAWLHAREHVNRLLECAERDIPNESTKYNG